MFNVYIWWMGIGMSILEYIYFGVGTLMTCNKSSNCRWHYDNMLNAVCYTM